VDEEEQAFIRQWEEKWERKKARERRRKKKAATAQNGGGAPEGGAGGGVGGGGDRSQRRRTHRRSISLGTSDVELELRKSIVSLKKKEVSKLGTYSRKNVEGGSASESDDEGEGEFEEFAFQNFPDWRQRSGTMIFFNTLSGGAQQLLTSAGGDGEAPALLMDGQPVVLVERLPTTSSPPDSPPRSPTPILDTILTPKSAEKTQESQKEKESELGSGEENEKKKMENESERREAEAEKEKEKEKEEKEEKGKEKEKEDTGNDTAGRVTLNTPSIAVPPLDLRHSKRPMTHSWKFVTTGIWKKEDGTEEVVLIPSPRSRPNGKRDWRVASRSRNPSDATGHPPPSQRPQHNHSQSLPTSSDAGDSHQGRSHTQPSGLSEEQAFRVIRCMRLEWEWERKKWQNERRELLRELQRVKDGAGQQCPKCGTPTSLTSTSPSKKRGQQPQQKGNTPPPPVTLRTRSSDSVVSTKTPSRGLRNPYHTVLGGRKKGTQPYTLSDTYPTTSHPVLHPAASEGGGEVDDDAPRMDNGHTPPRKMSRNKKMTMLLQLKQGVTSNSHDGSLRSPEYNLGEL